MTTFNTREKEFEARFKHDQKLQFKITARRTAVGNMGRAASGPSRRPGRRLCAQSREAQLQPGGTQNVVDKLAADLGAKDPMFTAARIRFELEHFTEHGSAS